LHFRSTPPLSLREMLYINRVYRDALRVHVMGDTIQLLMFLNLKVSNPFALTDFASASACASPARGDEKL
jgi:hypothetical protein